MLLTLITSLLLSCLAAQSQDEQIVYDAIHNATAITGTWSSGSRNVVTGAGFANPANQTFNYPTTTGVSYSFSEDGFYEIARYRFNSNGSEPSCMTGILSWVHGTYELRPNGSIVCTPMGDGFQQIQDPCAAQSNFTEFYNDTELYSSWRVFQNSVDGYKLHLFQIDGSPVAPQFQVSAMPNMLPTCLLRNVSPAFQTHDGFVSFGGGGNRVLVATPNAGVRRWGDVIDLSSVIAGLTGAGSLALLLL